MTPSNDDLRQLVFVWKEYKSRTHDPKEKGFMCKVNWISFLLKLSLTCKLKTRSFYDLSKFRSRCQILRFIQAIYSGNATQSLINCLFSYVSHSNILFPLAFANYSWIHANVSISLKLSFFLSFFNLLCGNIECFILKDKRQVIWPI